MQWEKTKIRLNNNKIVEAIKPVIISASRITDIPAFYSKWFFNRLKKGYILWINPYNRKKQYISLENVKLIVFWTKYADPIIPYLKILDKMNINYYFLYTINDYEKENLEPNLPALQTRIKSFINLSKLIDKQKVIWRFDPLILTDKINVENLLNKIENVGNNLYKYTERLIISFADIDNYKKVKLNLKKNNINYKNFSHDNIIEIAKTLNNFNKLWKIEIKTCSETVELSDFNIFHGSCIDDELIVKLFYKDKILMDFLNVFENSSSKNMLFTEKPVHNINIKINNKKNDNFSFINSYTHNKKLEDKGQRKNCLCIKSKDIGMYNSCPYLCKYCYANFNPDTVLYNFSKASSLNFFNESLIPLNN